MKTTLLAITSFIAAISFSAQAQTADKLNPGDNLPVVSATLLSATDGRAINLKDAAGKNGLLVMFSCNTCPFVVKNQPVTKKTMEYANTHGVGMIIINSNEAKRAGDDAFAAMKDYANRQQYTVPYVVDENSAIADMFGASHTPEVYLFNSQNKLVYKGAMNDNPGSPDAAKRSYIEDAINAMVAGKDADPKTTKSIGCGIKRKTS